MFVLPLQEKSALKSSLLFQSVKFFSLLVGAGLVG